MGPVLPKQEVVVFPGVFIQGTKVFLTKSSQAGLGCGRDKSPGLLAHQLTHSLSYLHTVLSAATNCILPALAPACPCHSPPATLASWLFLQEALVLEAVLLYFCFHIFLISFLQNLKIPYLMAHLFNIHLPRSWGVQRRRRLIQPCLGAEVAGGFPS